MEKEKIQIRGDKFHTHKDIYVSVLGMGSFPPGVGVGGFGRFCSVTALLTQAGLGMCQAWNHSGWKKPAGTPRHIQTLPSPHLLKNLLEFGHGCFRIKSGKVFGPSGAGGCPLVRGKDLGWEKKTRTKPGSCCFVFSVLEGKVVEQKNGENPGAEPHPLFREAIRHLSDN